MKSCIFVYVSFLVFNFSLFAKPIKYVITGGPSFGKTTLISALERRDFKCISEVATMLINEALDKGEEHPAKNRDTFQKNILSTQIKLEEKVDKYEGKVFCDRGLLDGIAYYRFDGLIPPEYIIDKVGQTDYELIFLVSPLKRYKKDVVRTENQEEALRIHDFIREVYEEFGYKNKIVEIPDLSVEERVEFVLNYLEDFKKIIPSTVIEKNKENYSDNEIKLINKDYENIKDLIFRDKNPSEFPIYVATAGAPGSCKSTILENYLSDKQNFVYIDPDQRVLKCMINTYLQSCSSYMFSKDSVFNVLNTAYIKWRGASNYIACGILNEAFSLKCNIAHGATSTNMIAIESIYKKLKMNNYKIILLLCYSNDEARINTIYYRLKNQGFIQSTYEDLINKGKFFPECFPIYFKYADEIKLYWTEDFIKGSINAATYTKKLGLLIHDKEALNSFIKKYDKDIKELNINSQSFDDLINQ